MISRKQEDTGSCRRKLRIALFGELKFGTGYGPVARQTTT
jgi:hypothetical protein